MNKNRKEQLFKKYGSIAEMKRATVEELQKLSGIGPKSAEAIAEWLQRIK